MADRTQRYIDLSHVIEHGMVTFGDLPGPHICDYWTRKDSAANYADGSSFQIGRIDMVAIDTPVVRGEQGAANQFYKQGGVGGMCR